jgi:carbon monoxide dehydrogenase subunit G
VQGLAAAPLPAHIPRVVVLEEVHMARVTVAIFLALAAIVGAVAWLGSRLPVGHVASRSVVIGAPIDVVFEAITNFGAATSWRSGVKSVTVATDEATGRQRVTEVTSSGSMTMETEQVIPPTKLVMRIVGEDLPYGGAWAYSLDPQGTATKVTITEHGEVYNPIFRFVAKFIMGHNGTIDTYLRDLGRKFGSDVVPTDAMPVPLDPRK